MRAALLLAAALLAGCVDLEVARLARVRAQASEAGSAAKGVGRSCVTILFVVPVTPMPDLGEAVAEAAGGGALEEAVVHYELRYVPLLGGRGCYVVRGRPS